MSIATWLLPWAYPWIRSGQTLYSAYGVRQISTIYEPANDYEVILEVDPRDQRAPSDLSKLYLRTVTNQPIPLSAISTVAQPWARSSSIIRACCRL